VEWRLVSRYRYQLCIGRKNRTLQFCLVVALPAPAGAFFEAAFFLAQSRTRRKGGKYSARIINPGMKKTNPGMMGSNAPKIPTSTRTTPKAIRSHFLSTYLPTSSIIGEFPQGEGADDGGTALELEYRNTVPFG